MYFDDLCIGFLCEQILRQITQLSIIRCPGCEQKHKLAILHQHEHHSLLDKVRLYFEVIRGSILMISLMTVNATFQLVDSLC